MKQMIPASEAVFARINTKGFIAEIEAVGPIKGTFVSKVQFAEMIRNKRDVSLVNPSKCQAFANKMRAYKEAIDKHDVQLAAKIEKQSEKEYDHSDKLTPSPNGFATSAPVNNGKAEKEVKSDKHFVKPVSVSTPAPAPEPVVPPAPAPETLGTTAEKDGFGDDLTDEEKEIEAELLKEQAELQENAPIIEKA